MKDAIDPERHYLLTFVRAGQHQTWWTTWAVNPRAAVDKWIAESPLSAAKRQTIYVREYGNTALNFRLWRFDLAPAAPTPPPPIVTEVQL